MRKLLTSSPTPRHHCCNYIRTVGWRWSPSCRIRGEDDKLSRGWNSCCSLLSLNEGGYTNCRTISSFCRSWKLSKSLNCSFQDKLFLLFPLLLEDFSSRPDNGKFWIRNEYSGFSECMQLTDAFVEVCRGLEDSELDLRPITLIKMPIYLIIPPYRVKYWNLQKFKGFLCMKSDIQRTERGWTLRYFL